jgi:2-oxo-4-hydroxy-4-carboxy-5-ureidoimidazoline decarboxylase
MKLDELNRLDEPTAREELLRCCHSSRWVEFVLSRRPFGSFNDLLKIADEGFAILSREDWLDAFSGHAKIGDVNSLRAKYSNTKDWSSNEQSGVRDAQEAVIQGLADGNADYEKRFGHIFIVCATGKTAAQMLEILRGRIDNDPSEELRIAAHEQSKITKIRLEKLCQEVPSQPTC